jgi:hypothetical protein
MPRSPQGLSVEIIGDVEGVQHMLEVLDTALNPLAISEFLGATVAPYLQTRAKARFANEGDDVVGGWVPLSEATQQFRERGREEGLWSVGDAHPINVRTHELENYITSGLGDTVPTPSGATLVYPRPTSRKTIRDKMKTAQSGKSDPNTPARPVIGLNESDMTFVLLSLASHIKKVGMP